MPVHHCGAVPIRGAVVVQCQFVPHLRCSARLKAISTLLSQFGSVIPQQQGYVLRHRRLGLYGRVKIHEDKLGFTSLACRMESYMDESVSRSQDHSNVFATDKRRMLWLIKTQALSSIGDEGVRFARRLKVEWPKKQQGQEKSWEASAGLRYRVSRHW